jgi:hypothetical protein
MVAETGKIFCSYARADDEFALKLAKDMKSAGASIWLDQLDIPKGQRWDRAVEEALQTCEYLLVILSPVSVESHNVMDEVSFALEEKKQVLPVLYRSCKLPFRLRRVQYIDFTVDYEDGLLQLRKALGEQPIDKPPPPQPQWRRLIPSKRSLLGALVIVLGLIIAGVLWNIVQRNDSERYVPVVGSDTTMMMAPAAEMDSQ